MTAPIDIAKGSRGRIASLLAQGRNYRAEVKSIAGSKRFIAFYGCGTIFEGLAGVWQEQVGRKIDFCCDQNPDKWNRIFSGVPCISPSELTKLKDEIAVFVTVGDFQPVLDFLALNEFPCVHLIYKYDLISSDYLARQNPEEVEAKLESVRSILDDARSLEVFDALLDRILDAGSPPGRIAEVCEPDQYFPSGLIRLKADEAFVDAGAFTGDTVGDFVERTGGSFASIHCFELDAENFQTLRSTVSRLPGSDRVFLHPEGLWSESREIFYRVEKTQSAIGAGEARGRVVRLDDVIGNARVTFLKMDIEGAELKALEGAKSTILRNKPTLAICVYHHLRDLWEIPLLVKSLVPEYRIFLRHHNMFEYETVCYAVLPENAIK